MVSAFLHAAGAVNNSLTVIVTHYLQNIAVVSVAHAAKYFWICFAIHIAYCVFFLSGDVLQSSHFNKHETALQVHAFCLFVVLQCFLLFSKFDGFSLS